MKGWEGGERKKLSIFSNCTKVFRFFEWKCTFPPKNDIIVTEKTFLSRLIKAARCIFSHAPIMYHRVH